ncbi:MAG: AI-2E family transporter, partial [Erysipelotrichaceae bacterium]|nr:AI-2E family transporter [Erysipelotrichaceae bacterium]
MNDEGNVWKTRFFKYGTIVLGVVLFGVFVFVFNYLNQAFITLMVTAFFTFILAKPVEWMEQKGIKRSIGTPIAITVTFIIAIACCVVFIPPIVEQTGRLINTMPEYIRMLQTKVLPKFPELQSLFSEENIRSLTTSAEQFLDKNGSDVAGAALSTVVKIAGGFGYVFGIGMVAMILTMTLL